MKKHTHNNANTRTKSLCKKQNVVFLFFIFLMMMSGRGITQTQTITPQITPNGIFDKVYDRFGNEYNLADLQVQVPASSTGTGMVINSVPTTSFQAGYFTLYFDVKQQQGTPFLQTVAAQTLICQFFIDISNFIHSDIPLGSINIYISDYPFILTSTNSIPYTHPAQASSFYCFPTNPSNPNAGLMDGLVHRALISGLDPYQNIPIVYTNTFVSLPIPSPSITQANFYHGILLINPDASNAPIAQWNTDLLSLPLSSPPQIDLYTVLLHEVGHMLGFASLTHSTGISYFGQNNNYYEHYDTFLKDAGGNPLLSQTSAGSYSFTASLSAILPSVSTCSAAIQFSTPSVWLKVRTPNPYNGLSHFEDLCSTPAFTPQLPIGCSSPTEDKYFVMSYPAIGSCYTKRYYKDEERLALCALGYSLGSNGSYSSSHVIFHSSYSLVTSPSTTLYAGINGIVPTYTYPTGACTPTNVIGINDGLQNGAYSFTTSGSSYSISLATLLANDIPSSGLSISAPSVSSVYSNATVSVAGGSLIVNATQGAGLTVLKYYPDDGTITGNATYVFVYFMPANCNASNACNMVQNAGFESTNAGAACGGAMSNTTQLVSCWESFGNAVAITRSCSTGTVYNLGVNTIGSATPMNSFNGTGNDRVVGLYCNPSGSVGSVIKNNLSSPLMSGTPYRFSFMAANVTSTAQGFNTNNAPVVITIATYSANNAVGIPTVGLYTIGQFTINSVNTWTQIIQVFTFTSSINQTALYVGISPVGSSTTNLMCYLDEFVLVPAANPSFNHAPICGNSSITDMAAHTSTSSVGTFSGNYVSYDSGTGQYHFNSPPMPLASGSLYPIAYTYTNGSCENTEYYMVSVANSENTVTPNATTICPYTSLTLTALGNYNTLVWQPGAETTSSIVVTPTVSTIYSVTTVMSNTLCSFTETIGIDVPASISSSEGYTLLDPWTYGGIGLNGTYTAVSPNTFGGYFITSDIWIDGTPVIWITGAATFSNADVIFAPNVRLIVEDGTTLNILGSHLHTCEGEMWQGIEVEENAILYIDEDGNGKSTFIEDAVNAISYTKIYNNVPYSNIDVHNTVFNKNHTDIAVTETLTYLPYNNDFLNIDNCVFTCRDLPFTNDNWVSVSTSSLGLRYAASSTTETASPYLHDNDYAPATLKAPYAGQTSFCGISLNNVGYTDATTNTYYGVTIGDSTDANNFNLFDNHSRAFIYAENSNLTLKNNVFQNRNSPYNGPMLPNYIPSSAVLYQSLDNTNRQLNMSATSTLTGNRFWNCSQGVWGKNIFDFRLSNAIMRSTQTQVGISPQAYLLGGGVHGLTLNSNRVNYYITNNEFTNIGNAINIPISLAQVSGGFSPVYGNTLSIIAIHNNTFSAGTPSNNGFMNQAVSITNPLGVVPVTPSVLPQSPALFPSYEWNRAHYDPAITFFHPTGIAITDNQINRVWNGISVNGITNFPVWIARNSLTLTEHPIGWTQRGIELSNGIANFLTGDAQYVWRNEVQGAGNSTANISLVYCCQNTGYQSPRVVCNDTKNANKGFVFAGLNATSSLTGMHWLGNSMANMTNGMRLEGYVTATATFSGVIGQQGNSSTGMGNAWIGGTAAWTGTTSYGIYTSNSTATSSPLYVLPITSNMPPNIGQNVPGQGNYNWDINNPGIYSSDYAFHCDWTQARLEANSFNPDFNNALQAYLAKAQLYQFLRYNDSIRTNDNDMSDWYDDITGSTNLGQLALVQEKLYTGHYAEARSMLAVLSAENYIEENDINFYNLYANYLEDINGGELFAEADSTALVSMAHLCPIEYGASVYKARALFNSIFNTVMMYEDCNVESSGERFANTENENPKFADKWRMELFPNPAQNKITLKSKNETEDLFVEIIDVWGRKVLNKRVKLKDYTADMEVNLINGVYFVRFTNAENKINVKKLTIAK